MTPSTPNQSCAERDTGIVLGLRENLGQFGLLVLVNAFVGGMIGMERSILPAIAEQEFHLAERSAVLSFIVVFGVVKAFTNYLAGRISDRHGRKIVLVAGWIVALPVPFLLMWGPSWNWILFANVLLGASQGLTWSATVIMKVDLVGPKQRGLAMGFNEFAGYLAVAAAAFATGHVAARYGLRPEPFYLGVGLAVVGLAFSALAVRETHRHVHREVAMFDPEGLAQSQSEDRRPAGERRERPRAARTERQEKERTNSAASDGSVVLGVDPSLTEREIFLRTTLLDRNLSAVTQAGLVNNLNDGMAWGLFPVVFAAARMDLQQIGGLAALYPAVWGIGQLFTGGLSDRIGRKGLIVWGMWIQAAGIGVTAISSGMRGFAVGAVLLGLGTAMVYPTLLAAIGDVAHPSWRAASIGVYRLWRDLGYALGALIAGITADAMGLTAAVGLVAALTFASGLIASLRMRETLGLKASREAQRA